MRNAIRACIPAAAAAAIASGVMLPLPHELPALALGNRELLWAERTLVLFYGFLLVFVPILRALQGELPIELSARGARYADVSETAFEELEQRVAKTEDLLDQTLELVDDLSEGTEDEGA